MYTKCVVDWRGIEQPRLQLCWWPAFLWEWVAPGIALGLIAGDAGRHSWWLFIPISSIAWGALSMLWELVIGKLKARAIRLYLNRFLREDMPTLPEEERKAFIEMTVLNWSLQGGFIYRFHLRAFVLAALAAVAVPVCLTALITLGVKTALGG